MAEAARPDVQELCGEVSSRRARSVGVGRRRRLRSTGASESGSEEAFGPLPLDVDRPRHVAAYVAGKSDRSGPATIGRDVSVLHAILDAPRNARRARTRERCGCRRASEAPAAGVADLIPAGSRPRGASLHRRAGADGLLDARADRCESARSCADCGGRGLSTSSRASCASETRKRPRATCDRDRPDAGGDAVAAPPPNRVPGRR